MKILDREVEKRINSVLEDEYGITIESVTEARQDPIYTNTWLVLLGEIGGLIIAIDTELGKVLKQSTLDEENVSCLEELEPNDSCIEEFIKENEKDYSDKEDVDYEDWLLEQMMMDMECYPH